MLGTIALVTGASRGIGKGIALELAKAGATVYITGRSEALLKAAKEIEDDGGKAIPIQCDHENDKEIKALFEKIKNEQNGRLDILVNNAYKAVDFLMKNGGKKFYEFEGEPGETWDLVNNVGLRNHYICSTYAAKMMVEREHGLIVNISSFGGLSYLFNAAYGVGKTALDRMSADLGHELKSKNVNCISLWPGPVKTETVQEHMEKNEAMKEMFGVGESTHFSGKCIAALYQDKNLNTKSGRILLTADLGDEYNLVDLDGKKVNNFRALNTAPIPWLKSVQSMIPSFVKIPYWLLHFKSYKF
ncbi:hypothetical protein SNEBB_005661 [Seison nebaliae]|nr:hypothetical protein SNEBB_005661 [Seison nebaliae]